MVELYLTSPATSAGQPAPIRALKGFRRVTLEAGASSNVDFVLDSRDLSSVRTDGTRVVTPGKYQLSVGGSQPGGPSDRSERSFLRHRDTDSAPVETVLKLRTFPFRRSECYKLGRRLMVSLRAVSANAVETCDREGSEADC